MRHKAAQTKVEAGTSKQALTAWHQTAEHKAKEAWHGQMARTVSRTGGNSPASPRAFLLNHARSPRAFRAQDPVLHLQQRFGNQNVLRFLDTGKRTEQPIVSRLQGNSRTPSILRGKEADEITPEEQFLEDLRSGTEKAQQYVDYITKAFEYWKEYGGSKPKEIGEAVENLIKITKSVSDGLERFQNIFEKVQTALRIKDWLESLGDFAEKSRSLDLRDPASVEAWGKSLNSLYATTEPLVDSIKGWLKTLAFKGTRWAGRAFFFLEVFTAYAEVGLAALNAGIRVVNAYRARQEEILSRIEGKKVRKPPPPEFPGPWYTAAEQKERREAWAEYEKRIIERQQRELKLREAIEYFDSKIFPRIYRRNRKKLKWLFLRGMKTQARRWTLRMPEGTAVIPGFGSQRWWDCLKNSGEETYFDEIAGIKIIPKRDTVTLDEARDEIYNLSVVKPPCPYFDRLYEKYLFGFLKRRGLSSLPFKK